MSDAERDAYEQARFRGELAKAREGDRVALAEVRHWVERKRGESEVWDSLIAEALPLLRDDARPKPPPETDPTRIDMLADAARAASGRPRTRQLILILFLALIGGLAAIVVFGGI